MAPDHSPSTPSFFFQICDSLSLLNYERDYHSCEELKQAIAGYIEGYIHYYNHERMKRKLNWQSPVQFREIALKAV